MQYLWFWTFWHWSKESFRSGALLRDPILGFGGHWDEWFRHEASEEDRRGVAAAGATTQSQRRFMTWLVRHWSREADFQGNRPPVRFVLGQLAHLPPFIGWYAFEKYQRGYGVAGISAIVLAAESMGEPADIRRVEAMALPPGKSEAASITSEGFHADVGDLEIARVAAMSALYGKATIVLLALWAAGGRRPYPRWLGGSLLVAWGALATSIVYLVVGPDPRALLTPLLAAVVSLWCALMLVAIGMVAGVVTSTLRQGRTLRKQLATSHVRLRMDGGLTIKGGSAGLPFSMNVLLSIFRAHADGAERSWLWRRMSRSMRAHGNAWSATGVVTQEGGIQPVVLEAKLRALLQHRSISHVITPRQRERRAPGSERRAEVKFNVPFAPDGAPHAAREMPLGFAASSSPLRQHPCRHIAQALLAAGSLNSPRQLFVTGFALAVTAVMFAATPGIGTILFPPIAPLPVVSASTSPYDLWVALDASNPDAFFAVLESPFWSNRRGRVEWHGASSPARAELPLRRVSRQSAGNEEDGTVWIERRYHFLTREFAPGERVGRFSFSYVSRLRHD